MKIKLPLTHFLPWTLFKITFFRVITLLSYLRTFRIIKFLLKQSVCFRSYYSYTIYDTFCRNVLSLYFMVENWWKNITYNLFSSKGNMEIVWFFYLSILLFCQTSFIYSWLISWSFLYLRLYIFIIQHKHSRIIRSNNFIQSKIKHDI